MKIFDKEKCFFFEGDGIANLDLNEHTLCFELEVADDCYNFVLEKIPEELGDSHLKKLTTQLSDIIIYSLCNDEPIDVDMLRETTKIFLRKVTHGS